MINWVGNVLFAANVFGKPRTNTDFLAYKGDEFKLSIPSKWNPRKAVGYPSQVPRHEDNLDANGNVTVMVTPNDKNSITDFGSPEDFLSKANLILILLHIQLINNQDNSNNFWLIKKN